MPLLLELVVVVYDGLLEGLLGQVLDHSELLALLRVELETVVEQRVLLVLVFLPLELDFRHALLPIHLVYLQLNGRFRTILLVPGLQQLTAAKLRDQ